MNIVIVGAHPDDPECGCGGLAIQAATIGHTVTFLYMSSGFMNKRYGDRPIVEVREAEAHAACKVYGVHPYFLRLQDGSINFQNDCLNKLINIFTELQTHVILTHWPIDAHSDHQATSILCTQAALKLEASLVYYEVAVGIQTFGFMQNRLFDISEVAAQKKQGCFCHHSQNMDDIWKYHDNMERFRGAQLGVARAEAYYLALHANIEFGLLNR